MQMQNRQKRIFEVTGAQIWVSLIIVAFALTIVFEVGVSVGKKRVIKAEKEAARQNDIQRRAATSTSTEVKLPRRLSTDQQVEQPAVEKKGVQYTVQVGTFGSHENAENLVNLIRSYEYKSWLRPESGTGETLYCVFVGRFDTSDEAEQFGELMRERLSYVNEYRVRKIEE